MDKKPLIYSKKSFAYFLSLIIIGIWLIYQGWHTTNPTNEVLSVASKPTTSPVASSSAEATSEAKFDTSGLVTARVIRVVDGDTIEVNLKGQLKKLRYVGINTPETVDPRRPVQCFGHEASDKNKSLVNGKTVILTKDVSDTDKYDRLLRFVYLPQPDGKLLFVNDYLVREGYAQSYPYPPDVKFEEQFRQAEKEARDQNRGLWAKCK